MGKRQRNPQSDAQSTTVKIDLHGMTVQEALRYFVTQYNKNINHPYRKIMSVVHGFGSSGVGGTIRKAVRKLLEQNNSRLEYWPGEDIDGNQGWTYVRGIKELPTVEDRLQEEILAFCGIGKSLDKIENKFRRYGHETVSQATRALKQRGALREYNKGKYRIFVRA